MTAEEKRAKHAAYMREWNRRHPGYASAQYHKRRDANPDHVKRVYDAYRERNKERIRARILKWKASNPERVKEHKRKDYEKRKPVLTLQNKKWATANPDKVKIARSEWKKRNPHNAVEREHRRRARKRAVSSENCTRAAKILRLERFCRWCCVRLTKQNFTIDHIIPLARGGDHAPNNLAACCKHCNSSKGTKLIQEWTWEAA